jgi:hypothetical protein
MKNCPHRSCLIALVPAEVIQTLAQLPEVLTLTRRQAGITFSGKKDLRNKSKSSGLR